MIDGEYSVSGWNRYMYCAGNPVLYKDPSGHFIEELFNFFKGDGFRTNNEVIEDKISHNKATITDIENYIKSKNGGKAVNLKNGLKVVVLKNFFDKDTSLNKTQKKKGGYTTRGPKGEDKFMDKMLIINDGKIDYSEAATSRASIVPKYRTNSSGQTFRCDKNAGNDLLPGSYKIKGDFWCGRSLRIYESQSKMNIDDRRVDSTKGANSQRGLHIHNSMSEGSVYSGSTGCTVAPKFKEWSKEFKKSNNSWSSVKGDYYLVDSLANK